MDKPQKFFEHQAHRDPDDRITCNRERSRIIDSNRSVDLKQTRRRREPSDTAPLFIHASYFYVNDCVRSDLAWQFDARRRENAQAARSFHQRKDRRHPESAAAARGTRAYCALRYCRFAVLPSDNVIAAYREGLEPAPGSRRGNKQRDDSFPVEDGA